MSLFFNRSTSNHSATVVSDTRRTGWRERLAGWKTADGVLARWRSSGLRAQVAGLADHETALEHLGIAVERKFVAIGDSLQTQATLSTQLVEQSARLLALASSKDEEPKPVVAQAVELVEQILRFADDVQRQTVALVDRIERYHDQIGRLLYEEQRVERIVAPLRVIQTLFRIEAAVLPVDVQTAFVALSGEIPKFETKVREAFAQHSEMLTLAQRRIELTAARLREDGARQIDATAVLRNRIGETLSHLVRELELSRARDSQLETIVREMDRGTGAVVVSLQYQDITRQKMEHVRAGLGEILNRSQTGGRFSGTVDLRYLHQACRLEALQSKAIHDELDGAMTALRSGVRDMLDQLARIDRECWPRAESGQAAEVVENRANALRDALHQSSALLPLAAAGATEAITLLNSFGDVAASVAATASEMAEDMRMIALNAQVQAAQAGEAGAGLLILAERTYFISEEIKQVTRSIGTEFAEAARQLEGAVGEGARLRTQIEDRRAPLLASSDSVEKSLRFYQAETVQVLQDVAALLEQIERAGQHILPELENDPDFCGPLMDLHDELARIVAKVESFAGSQAGDLANAEPFDAVKRRYTMDSERAVHASAFSGAGVAAAVATESAEEGASSGPAASDSNIELF